MSIVGTLIDAFKFEAFSLQDAYKKVIGVNKESIRARIYEHLGVKFKKLGRGLYINKNIVQTAIP